jgi:hypothetical protein
LEFGVEKLNEDEQRGRAVWEVKEIVEFRKRVFGSCFGKKRATS